jgi:hypothetical protein
MGYRKKSAEQHKWNQWIESHRAELLSAGLPDFL